MDKAAAMLKAAPVAMLLLALPAGAASAATAGASNLATILSLSPSLVERVHCRRFVHTHRVCVSRRGRACRSWRVVRHRCP
jgi:hypothetical protein